MDKPKRVYKKRSPRAKKTKTSNNNGSGDVADDGGATTAWYNVTSADIFKNRNNPRNGVDCFFSEASYNQIMGPRPSFKEKLLSQIARIKEEKQNEASQNKTNPKVLEQKSKFPAILFIPAGELKDQGLADILAGSCESVDQGLNGSVNNETLDNKFKSKVSSSTLAVEIATLDQDLKKSETMNNSSLNQNVNNSVTVNNGSLNQNGNNSVTMNSGSLNQNVNSDVAVNSGPQNLNVKNSMIENNVSTVSANNKQAQLSNCQLVSNIASVSSEMSAEQINVNRLNLMEPELNDLYATDDVDTEVVENIPMVSLPIEVSICDNLTESIVISNAAKGYADKKPGDIKDNETTSDIVVKHSLSVKLEPEELEKNIGNLKPDIPRVSEDSLHTSVSVSQVDTDVSSLDAHEMVVTCALTSYLNSASSDTVHCGVASNTSTMDTAVTPIGLDTETSISNLLLQNSKQSDSDYLRHEEIEQLSSVQQNLNGTTEVTNVVSCYSDNQTQDLSENLKSNITNETTAVTAASEDHTVILSQTNSSHKEENLLVLDIAEVPENNSQAPLLNRDSTEDENVPSSSQDAQELCLVMASLSSDDDDDDGDEENNFIGCISSPARKHPHNEDAPSKNSLSMTASLDNQPSSAALVAVSDISANIATLNPPLVDHGDGSSSCTFPPAIVNIQEDEFLKTGFETETQACSWENNMPDAQSIEMPILSGHQQLVQEAALLGIPFENSANWQATLAPTWSEVDIPIFSVKEVSPEHVKCMESTAVKQKEGQLQESVDKEGDRPLPKISPVEDLAATQKNIQFRRSDLTREEHATYLKLYNRYVTMFMLRGPPPVLTELQRKEITIFEALQRRVQAEQSVFQNYLLQNARKNQRSYTFLRTVARNYATCRAKSFRVKPKCATKYKQTFDCHIPFCEEGSLAVLKFQQALLEIGLPPRIKLPDLQAGQKPVPVPYDIRKLDTSFPRFSKKTFPGSIHHESVSYDMNVKTLATKYDFQVAMSSSVAKCLLNNHGPTFDRAWNLPVHVSIHDIDGENRTIVYLDKPLFEDDFHVKDYSSLFHKYALRTFVSHPRSKAAAVTKRLSNQPKHTEETPCEVDDPFDMSSSNVDNLETFGAGCSKLFRNERTPTENAQKDVKPVVTELETWEPGHKLLGRNFRSKRKYPNWDKVTDDVNELEVKKPGNNFNIQSTFKKCRQRKSGQADNSTDLKPDNGDVVSDCEPTKKHSKIGQVDEDQDREKIMHTCSPSVLKESSLSVNTDDSPQSPEADHTEPFDTTQSPLSPIASPASPCAMNQNISPNFIIQQIPLSPVKEIPSSPVRASPPPTLLAKSFQTSPNAAPSQPCRRSPRIKANMSESPKAATRVSQKANSVSKMSRPSGRPQGKLFTPLDSILGPSFGQPEVRDSPDIPKENPSHYLPPTEVHSSIEYNLWSLGSLNVLIRTRCHGVLKDIKKARKVYFTSKMEYQSTYGLEQVTLDEMTREWTACFIRPNTNLLRARINAFTSEILMFEEVESNQILRPSLNYKPESGFQFLDRVLQTLMTLQPGYYLLSHEPGDNFCGIRSLKNKSDSDQPNENASTVTKKKTRENQLPWIPIDPTLLLPYHIVNNRIPATFLPKDLNFNNNSGGVNKRNPWENAQNNGTDNRKPPGFWKKLKAERRKNKSL
ncbi:hypothetical protein BsWGS_17705 [Bradybaena similaris]